MEGEAHSCSGEWNWYEVGYREVSGMVVGGCGEVNCYWEDDT